MSRNQFPELPAKEGGLQRAGVMVIVAVVISLIECRITNLIHLSNLSNIVQQAYQVTIGEPHWVEYQNRLLGPFLFRFLTELLPLDKVDLYLTLLLYLHLLKNLLCLTLVYRLTSDLKLAIRSTVFFAIGFLVLQHQRWLYLWDYLDNAVFLVFLYGVFREKGDSFFLLLFVPAILNKESGLFIPLWLALDSLLEQSPTAGLPLTIRLRNPHRLFWGLFLAGIGVAWVYGTRKLLLVKETAAAANPVFAADRPCHLLMNLKQYFVNLTHPSIYDLNILKIGLPLALLIGSWVLWRKKPSVFLLKQILLVLIIFSSLLVFGLISEVRVYNVLLPFALFGALYYFHDLPKQNIGPPISDSRELKEKENPHQEGGEKKQADGNRRP